MPDAACMSVQAPSLASRACASSLPASLGVGLELRQALLVVGLGLLAELGAGLRHALLIVLDLALPGRELALELLGEVLLQRHDLALR